MTTIQNGGGIFTCFRTTGDSWAEDSVTWSNGPSRGEAISTAVIDSTGEWAAFDVTQYLKELVAAGESAMTLWIEDASQQSGRFECDSRRSDKANPPELEVVASGASSSSSGCDGAVETAWPASIGADDDASLREGSPSSNGNWGSARRLKTVAARHY